jgi:purine-binding chemotaxis protein CheW
MQTEQAAGAPAPESAGSAEENVVVRLGGCRYGLPVRAVAEVGRPPGLTRVPGLPDWVAGAANWRGRVLAVLDVRPLLSAEQAPLDRRGRMVVLSARSVQVGLLVEAVEGTLDVDPAQVEPPLASLPGRTASLLSGQLTDASGVAGPCGLLDLAALLGLADELPRVRRAG